MAGTNHRYGYAGAYGYQTDNDFSFVHVGARYYDPGTARFLQRDPIGLGGGLNVYAHLRSRPVALVDPNGLRTDMGWDEPPGGYPGPKPNPNAQVEPEPLSPEQELERVKKRVYVVGGCSGLLGLRYWPFAAGAGLAGLIDQLIHWDEPVNPVIGGSYENL